MQSKNLGVFIDEANIYHSQKTLGWKVDYLKLKKYLSRIGQIKVLHFYTSYQQENSSQNKRFETLEQNGYEVIKKKLKFIKTKNYQYVKKEIWILN